MTRKAKNFLLLIAKRVGAFHIARRITRRHLRILCYHGIAITDEQRFRPTLFMTGDTFRRRMELLAAEKYPILTLDDALQRLQKGDLPANAVVITIDDGWYSSYLVMAPLLAKARFPATMYISSYYMEKQTQVFNVAVDYMLWKSESQFLDLSIFTDRSFDQFDLRDKDGVAGASTTIKRWAETLEGADARQQLLRSLAEVLGVDWSRVEMARALSFVSSAEAQALVSFGVDVQLHTHRHRLSMDSFEDVRCEIDCNRCSLASVTRGSLKHFCYPSGNFRDFHYGWLKTLGIVSATTTNPGLNGAGTNFYALRRLLDSDADSDLEFEAKVSGFMEVLRVIVPARVPYGGVK